MHDDTAIGSTSSAEEEDLRQAKTRQEQLRRQEKDDFRRVMSSMQGRRLVWRLLERCGIYRTSFTGESSTTFFNEGRRNIGLWVTDEIFESCPEAHNQMTSENRNNKGQDQ